MAYDRFISKQWLKRMERSKDPNSNIIMTHLLVEYGLNYLIGAHCSNSKVILNDHRAYTFAVKLNFVFAMKLIPEELYTNIRKLNNIRNTYAHELNVNFKTVDLCFHDPEKRVEVKDFSKNKYFSDPPTEEQIQNVVGWIGLVTFGWIHKLILGLPQKTEKIVH